MLRFQASHCKEMAAPSMQQPTASVEIFGCPAFSRCSQRPAAGASATCETVLLPALRTLVHVHEKHLTARLYQRPLPGTPFPGCATNWAHCGFRKVSCIHAIHESPYLLGLVFPLHSLTSFAPAETRTSPATSCFSRTQMSSGEQPRVKRCAVIKRLLTGAHMRLRALKALKSKKSWGGADVYGLLHHSQSDSGRFLQPEGHRCS